MRRTILILLTFSLIVALVACQPSSTNVPTVQPTDTIVPIETLTPTPLPTATITPSPTVTLTATPVGRDAATLRNQLSSRSLVVEDSNGNLVAAVDVDNLPGSYEIELNEECRVDPVQTLQTSLNEIWEITLEDKPGYGWNEQLEDGRVELRVPIKSENCCVEPQTPLTFIVDPRKGIIFRFVDYELPIPRWTVKDKVINGQQYDFTEENETLMILIHDIDENQIFDSDFITMSISWGLDYLMSWKYRQGWVNTIYDDDLTLNRLDAIEASQLLYKDECGNFRDFSGESGHIFQVKNP